MVSSLYTLLAGNVDWADVMCVHIGWSRLSRTDGSVAAAAININQPASVCVVTRVSRGMPNGVTEKK